MFPSSGSTTTINLLWKNIRVLVNCTHFSVDFQESNLQDSWICVSAAKCCFAAEIFLLHDINEACPSNTLYWLHCLTIQSCPSLLFHLFLLLLPSTAQKNQFMTPNGFTMYMLSKENCAFNPDHSRVYQDMRRPLAHYFISSSHNTYLTKDQLTGDSSTEPYIR